MYVCVFETSNRNISLTNWELSEKKKVFYNYK